jgi:hypothetical protein
MDAVMKNQKNSPTDIPMRAEMEHSALHRWLEKTVHESRLLDDMESPGHWQHPLGPPQERDGEGTKTGYGEMLFTHERCKVGIRSLRLTSPTSSAVVNKVINGRPYGRATARRIFPGEDWSAFNRLSFWVYPTCPGFHTISMLVELHNGGEVAVPDKYEREGLDYFLLEPCTWNHVVWEIPHLARDHVTALDFIYRLQGSEPGAAETVCFDIDLLELQRVDADQYEGWNVAPGKIAFCHTGYLPGMPKIAIAPGPAEAAAFELIDADTGRVRLQKNVRTVATARGTFAVLDFAEVDDPGNYRLRFGAGSTGIFRIGRDIWDRTIWKTLNFLYCERCGYPVPGGHDVCHGDWQCSHGDKRIVINGGWHDAGDLSQGIYNTADAAYWMFRLAQLTQADSPVLGKRLMEEAQWGLAWVRKTRFGDGYRCGWAFMDFWTDGIIGTRDDITFEATNSPFDNFLGAMVEARAALAVRESDPQLADRCRSEAAEDWRFGLGEFGKYKGRMPHEIVVAAACVLASLELYRATRESRYCTTAFEFGGKILDSQQLTYTNWQVPFCGFFYADQRKEKLLADPHLTRYDMPVVALAELCLDFPTHPDWIRWYTAVALHAEFLRSVSRFTEPYRMLSAGIYRLDGSQQPDYREQTLAGIKLDEMHYLRLFPVWYSARGNHSMQFAQAKTLSAAMLLRQDRDLGALFHAQLEWVMGRNPFAQSMMYGEGYDFAPQYSAMCGDIVGALPVGIQTRGNGDEPYWPATNCYNFKEVWVHASARWLALMADAYVLARSGICAERNVHAVSREVSPGRIEIAARPAGKALTRCELRSANLDIDIRDKAPGEQGAVTWQCTLRERRSPWIAVVIPDGDIDKRVEIAGPMRPDAG